MVISLTCGLLLRHFRKSRISWCPHGFGDLSCKVLRITGSLQPTTTSAATSSSLKDLNKKIRQPYTITKSREGWIEQEHDKTFSGNWRIVCVFYFFISRKDWEKCSIESSQLIN
ncbi:unnamed protein product, partial [Vitis vinifera]|uniref:Uncharacterized protein n=1 Tax=Vitis vinifera TaxID=29760 RepID=D7TYE2_VITVI